MSCTDCASLVPLNPRPRKAKDANLANVEVCLGAGILGFCDTEKCG